MASLPASKAFAPPGLVRGHQVAPALARLRPAGAAAVLGVAVHPPVASGQASATDSTASGGAPKLQLVAVAPPPSADGSAAAPPVLLDATDPAVPKALGSMGPLAAIDAKPVHQAMVRAWGWAPKRWACATLCQQLLASGRSWPLSLDDLAAHYQLPVPPPAASGMAALAEHARFVAALVAKQGRAIKQQNLTAVSRLEAAAVAPIAAMELHGMPFERERWRGLIQANTAELVQVSRRILQVMAGQPDHGDVTHTEASGTQVNLDGTLDIPPIPADADLKAALCAAGHPVENVRRETLAKLPQPLGPLLLRQRALGKLLSTYGSEFLSHVGTDGRIHPTFVQIGASTGRMACHNPNLQAMVKDSDRRACFRAGPGRTLVTGDYATCELRILAEMSGDPIFAQAFERGDDLHSQVACRLFGKPVSKSEHPQLRHRAKAVNFGLVYGMGAGGLARALGISTPQAGRLLDQYFRTFPKIGQFLNDLAHQGQHHGEVRTLSGRRLLLREESETGPGRPTDASEAARIGRIAKNMPIQGTSADMTKLALARLQRDLAPFRQAWLVNAVHDELVVECNVDDAPAVQAAMVKAMEQAGSTLLRHTPVVVDSHVHPTWDKTD